MGNEHRSPWALVIIVVVVILFGLFWITQQSRLSENHATPQSAPLPQKPASSLDTPADLEAAIGAIDIPDYSQ